MPTRRSGPTAILLVSAIFAASGCTVGPYLIRGSRTRYNSAVQMTTSEEMLLNLVRARYGDPPEFLAVSGITTQFEAEGGVGLGNEFGLGTNRWAGQLRAADRPTVSLTPLQDEKFTRRFLSPISLDTIYLFSRNGHGVERVLRLVVEQINGVRNSPSGAAPEAAPGAFVWLAKTLAELAERQQVEFAYEQVTEKVSPPISLENVRGDDVVAAYEKGSQFRPSGEDRSVVLTRQKNELVLRISPFAVESPEVAGIAELLRLAPGQTVYPLEPAVEGQLNPASMPQDELHISTRSVEEILHFLCHGILVPPRHVEMGLVGDGAGRTPACGDQASDLLQVRFAKRRPREAAVAVHYQGHWFYIDACDAASKETFELLLELYNLEIRGGGAGALPVLALPIGR